jgi:hypothetical protein
MSRKLFVSYSHEDKSVAKHVAEALSQRGYEVFWDAKIPTGMTFDTYIASSRRGRSGDVGCGPAAMGVRSSPFVRLGHHYQPA